MIIPVYNAETTLARIVEQVLAQTLCAKEIILINDGSTDASWAVMDAWQKMHPHIIKVVNQPNSGVSVARNAGIAVSSGRYLTFIDADDEVAPGYPAHMMEPMSKDGSDLVVAGYCKLPQGSVSLCRATFDRTEYQDVIMTRDIGVTFCKVYDGDVIREKGISFPVGMRASEDAVFFYRYLMHSRRCTFVSSQDYTYYAPQPGKDYNLDLPARLIGLKAMGESLIALMENLPLGHLGRERLRSRLVLTLHNVLYAIAELPRKERTYFYKQIDWKIILPYCNSTKTVKCLIKQEAFLAIEAISIIESRIMRRPAFCFIR